MNTLPETLDIEEAAAMMKAKVDTIEQIARRGDLPGTKIGKCRVFFRSDVIAYLRHVIDDDTENRRRKIRSAITMCSVIVEPPRGRRRPLPVLPDLRQ